jgi:type II secretory pathway component PulF
MSADPPPTPLSRVRAFWRRTLRGPGVGGRIEIYEELAPTVGAGIGIREALDACADRHGGAKRRALMLLADALARDVPLSETMRAHPETFSAVEAALVATGERTGRLDAAFRAAAAQLERSRGVRNRIVQAVAYPVLLVHCFILMCSLVRMFGGGSFLGIALPSFVAFWGGLFVLTSVHVALSRDARYSQILASLPVAGRVVRAGALGRFLRAFAALHGAGVAYEDCLRLSAEASADGAVGADAETAIRSLAGGAPLAFALSQMSTIPVDDRGLLLAGEQSGELETAANRAAALEESRFDVVLKRATTLLPGCLVLLIGIAVGWYAISFYAGIYKDF